MLQKKIYHRAWRLGVFLLFMICGAYLILSALSENIVFFHPPSDLKKLTNEKLARKIRVGGLVKKGQVHYIANSSIVHFTITDNSEDLRIVYSGAVPALFREGQGVVAEGKMDLAGNVFRASSLLTKHDEKYYPKGSYKSE
jgi:cytochrome c-type biogenesis protein CcmE